MKKILLVVAVLFVVNSAFSQEIKWGIKTGANLSSLPDFGSPDNGGKLFGFHAGVFTNISCGDVVSFQPELLFSEQGGKYKSRWVGFGWDHFVIKLNYVQLPLLFEIKPIANLGILVGPQLGLNVSRKVTSIFSYDEDWDFDDPNVTINHNIKRPVPVTKTGANFDKEFFHIIVGFKKLNASMVFGLQYTIQRVTIGARYNLGLVNRDNYPHGYSRNIKIWRSNVIQAGLEFSF